MRDRHPSRQARKVCHKVANLKNCLPCLLDLFPQYTIIVISLEWRWQRWQWWWWWWHWLVPVAGLGRSKNSSAASPLIDRTNQDTIVIIMIMIMVIRITISYQPNDPDDFLIGICSTVKVCQVKQLNVGALGPPAAHKGPSALLRWRLPTLNGWYAPHTSGGGKGKITNTNRNENGRERGKKRGHNLPGC